MFSRRCISLEDIISYELLFIFSSWALLLSTFFFIHIYMTYVFYKYCNFGQWDIDRIM